MSVVVRGFMPAFGVTVKPLHVGSAFPGCWGAWVAVGWGAAVGDRAGEGEGLVDGEGVMVAVGDGEPPPVREKFALDRA